MSRRGTLTEKDRLDWAAYAGRSAPTAPKAPERVPAATARPAATPASRRPDKQPQPLAVGDQPGGLDKASWHRFRSGKLGPERTLDLHGRTAQRAHHALHTFLHAAHADGIRCVEVVTGRGTGEAGGVLRREFPLWLNGPALRPLVLAAVYPHAANQGAVRLLLRRSR
jgi:DNA-nicking Smr family endonuclease